MAVVVAGGAIAYLLWIEADDASYPFRVEPPEFTPAMPEPCPSNDNLLASHISRWMGEDEDYQGASSEEVQLAIQETADSGIVTEIDGAGFCAQGAGTGGERWRLGVVDHTLSPELESRWRGFLTHPDVLEIDRVVWEPVPSTSTTWSLAEDQLLDASTSVLDVWVEPGCGVIDDESGTVGAPAVEYDTDTVTIWFATLHKPEAMCAGWPPRVNQSVTLVEPLDGRELVDGNATDD